MNAHQFAVNLDVGVKVMTLAIGFGYGWRGFVRLARRVGN